MRGFIKRFLPAAVCLLLLCQAALAYSTLEKGASGGEVTRMQQALTALGYTVNADGVFGTETRNVVKAFQRDHDLTVDGKAGDQTLTLLYALYAQLSQALPATEAPQLTAPPTAAPLAQQGTALVFCADGGKLNLRTGAGTGYKAIAQIPTGERVTVTERGSKWCSVIYRGQSGYVMSSFLIFDGAAQATATPAAPAPTGAAAGLQAYVACDDGGKLNLRQAPSSSAKILARIPNGTLLAVQPAGGKWYAASYNGESGYVKSSFLDFSTAPAPTATPAPQISAAPLVTAAPAATATPLPQGMLSAVVECADGGKLNLRKTASSSAKVLDRIPSGTALTVQRVDSKWCSASYNGQSGYVMSKFLRFAQDAPQPTAAPVTAAPQPGAISAVVSCKNGGKLNLREGADTGYKVIYQLPNGSVLSVLTRGASWSRVSYGNYTGYVNNDFLRFTEAAATPTPTPAPVPVITSAPGADPTNSLRYEEFRYATVRSASGSLNVRRGPGTEYGKVSELRDGTQIVISSIAGDWCAMYYGDIQGYVMKEYLVISAPSGTGEATAVYDTSMFTRVLRSGYTGQDVDVLQSRLMALGYPCVATGTYDDATMAAVRAFQRQHGLTEDGLAGTNTIAQLFSSGAMAYSPSSTAESYSTYVMDYRTNTSDAKTAAVRRAQQALRALNYNVPLTGAFEARTHDAIVAFQLRNGLTASGVLDPATQRILYSGAAHDVAWPSRYYLPENAGTAIAAPTGVHLLHWGNDVTKALSGQSTVTAYDPATGLSWRLSILSRGRHLDVQPTTLEDTLLQKKSFGSTSWDIHVVYILLPDGRWSMAAMHDYPHGSNTIMNNGFGGQNCVHFLRDMAEAQQNDPSYGVQNQEKLREAWYKLTGIQITD